MAKSIEAKQESPKPDPKPVKARTVVPVVARTATNPNGSVDVFFHDLDDGTQFSPVNVPVMAPERRGDDPADPRAFAERMITVRHQGSAGFQVVLCGAGKRMSLVTMTREAHARAARSELVDILAGALENLLAGHAEP